MSPSSAATISRVALVRCDAYEPAEVRGAIDRGIALLGGVETFVAKDERIVLKPNLLVAAPPDSAATTHPAVFGAVAQALLEAGIDVRYGDSPGVGGTRFPAKRAGLAKVADTLAVPPADVRKGETVSFLDGKLIKQFTLAKGIVQADGFVSLPKLKTHGLTRFTGAVKNQFGCIPGMLKAEFHARMPTVERFAQMLVDLNRCIPARLYVMDAIIGMEGNGPRSGHPRPIHALLFSTDPVALDATACRLINLDPTLVPTNRWGVEWGLGQIENVEVVGDALQELTVPDFDVNRSRASTTGERAGLFGRAAKRLLVQRPVIIPEKCTRCGTCVSVCPVEPKAVDWHSGRDAPPKHDYARCIRCYCCQELCPAHAIEIKKSLLGRLLMS